MKFLDNVGLTYWTSKFKSYVNNKIEDLKTLLSKDIEKKQDELTAGSNVQIDSNNVISATDTKYTHPSSHPASMITEDAEKRFVSDTEKSSWNNKVGTTDLDNYKEDINQTLQTVNQSLEDKQDKLTAGANITITNNKISAIDTKYTHPSTHSASIITETTDKKFMTSVEKTKLDGIEDNANNYTHPSTHSATMITETTAKRFVSDTEKTTWNNKQDKLTAGANITIDSDNNISATVPEVNYPVQSVNSKTGAVTITKSDVGLGNVDNVKQMPISGGVLENYREKLVTLTGTSPTINLNDGNVFTHTVSTNAGYSISNAGSEAHSFTLLITKNATAVRAPDIGTITFPASIKWQGEEIPDLSGAYKTYVLTFLTVDGGTTWLGMFGGEF